VKARAAALALLTAGADIPPLRYFAAQPRTGRALGRLACVGIGRGPLARPEADRAEAGAGARSARFPRSRTRHAPTGLRSARESSARDRPRAGGGARRQRRGAVPLDVALVQQRGHGARGQPRRMFLELRMRPWLYVLRGHQGAPELAHRAVLEPGRDTVHRGRGRVALPPGGAAVADRPRVLELAAGVPEPRAPTAGEGTPPPRRTLSTLVEAEAEVAVARPTRTRIGCQ